MEIALDLQEKEKELEALKIKEQVKSLELKHTRTAIIAIVLGAMVLFSIINLFFFQKKRR
jgi:hypothetical protein